MAVCKVCGTESDLPDGRKMCRPCYNKSRLGARKNWYQKNPIKAFWASYHQYLGKGFKESTAWAKAARWAAAHVYDLDNVKCELCDNTAAHRHHLNLFEDVLSIQLLCHGCHNMVHRNE